MTSRELILQLQKIDPTGEMSVTIPDTDHDPETAWRFVPVEVVELSPNRKEIRLDEM
jgi:hypothetical protein